MNVGIYIYDDAEILDFSGPYEVFTTASRISDNPVTFNVFLVGETGETVTARSNYKVKPHYNLRNHPTIDILIISGGVHANELEKQQVISWIHEQAREARLVASVCTGVFLLAEAKVLSSQAVTTHWEDIPDLRKAYPNLEVIDNQRWVDEGKIITSGGISAGIDMSLHIVSRTQGQGLAEKTAKQMEFTWTKST